MLMLFDSYCKDLGIHFSDNFSWQQHSPLKHTKHWEIYVEFLKITAYIPDSIYISQP